MWYGVMQYSSVVDDFHISDSWHGGDSSGVGTESATYCLLLDTRQTWLCSMLWCNLQYCELQCISLHCITVQQYAQKYSAT